MSDFLCHLFHALITILITILMYKCQWEFLLLLNFLGHSSNEEVSVQVEAFSALGALAFDVWLIVYTQHGISAIACHHQLMPAALADLHLADHSPCAGAGVEPERNDREKLLDVHSCKFIKYLLLCWCFFHAIKGINDFSKSIMNFVSRIRQSVKNVFRTLLFNPTFYLMRFCAEKGFSVTGTSCCACAPTHMVLAQPDSNYLPQIISPS